MTELFAQPSYVNNKNYTNRFHFHFHFENFCISCQHLPWGMHFTVVNLLISLKHKQTQTVSNACIRLPFKKKKNTQQPLYIFFFFFRFGFYSPFKIISLISSRSFIKGGRKWENLGENHLTIRKQNLAFPHVTRARRKPQR